MIDPEQAQNLLDSVFGNGTRDENIKEEVFKTLDENPFILEYPMSDSLDQVTGLEAILDPEEISFALFYYRLLKAYITGNDSRFMFDALLTGIHTHSFFLKHRKDVTNAMSLRASFIRSADALSPNASTGLTNNIVSWVLTDIVSIKHDFFIPTDVSGKLIKMQAELNNANSTNRDS